MTKYNCSLKLPNSSSTPKMSSKLAIVEFSRRKISIVPLIWLFENNSKCLWPPNISTNTLRNMVINSIAPKKTWLVYDIIKVINTADDYETAEKQLNLLIEESSSEPHNNLPLIVKQNLHPNENASNKNGGNDDNDKTLVNSSSESESELENRIPKKKSKKSKRDQLHHRKNDKHDRKRQLHKRKNIENDDNDKSIINSSSEGSDLENRVQNKKSKKSNIDQSFQTKKFGSTDTSNVNSKMIELLESDPFAINKDGYLTLESPQRATSAEIISSHSSASHGSIQSSFQSSSHTSSHRSSHTSSHTVNDDAFKAKVIKALEKLVSTQEQHSLYLDELLRSNRLTNVQAIVKPLNTPELPIKSSHEIIAFEQYLENNTNYNYMRRRLASVGGTSVRTMTMSIMKTIMTNEIGMSYNWAGREKKCFKETKIMEIINDAVKLAYQGRENSDLTDASIANAVKDWLKLAKHRHLYGMNKK